MTVSEWLHYLAQNDHMIDGKYLESGHALLSAQSVYDAAMRLYDGIESGEFWIEVEWSSSDGEAADRFMAECRRAKGAMACGHSVGSLSDPAPDFIGDRKPSIGTVHCRECEAEAQRRAKEGQ